MIKKNLKTKLVRREQPSSIPTKKKLLPKRRVVEDEVEEDELDEDGEVELEDEEEETPVVKKKKLVPRSKVVEEDDEEVEEDDEVEEDEEPVLKKKKAGLGSKKGRSALAKAFDSVPLSNSADDIPAGKYECIIREARVHPFSDERGQNITFKYEWCAEPHEGKQMTQWFKIIDASEEPVDWMIDMLKQAFVRLGIEIEGDDLEGTIQEINDTHPGIILKLSYSKGKDGNTYPRFAIQGECNNDVVEAYKDNVAY